MTPRIYADFQNLDDDNRPRLTCEGTRRDLEVQGVSLREGMPLLLSTDDEDDDGRPNDLIVEGIATYDRDSECWVATVDWKALRHAERTPTALRERQARVGRRKLSKADKQRLREFVHLSPKRRYRARKLFAQAIIASQRGFPIDKVDVAIVRSGYMAHYSERHVFAEAVLSLRRGIEGKRIASTVLSRLSFERQVSA